MRAPSKVEVTSRAKLHTSEIKASFYEDPLRSLVNHIQDKISFNKIRYKCELRFECDLQV